MLPKQNSLTKDKQFEKVFKKGRSKYAKYFGLKFVPNNLDINRYGIIISKKVSKKAVTRNLIKRRVKAVIHEFNINKGYDIVIIALARSADADFRSIKKDLAYLFKVLRLM